MFSLIPVSIPAKQLSDCNEREDACMFPVEFNLKLFVLRYLNMGCIFMYVYINIVSFLWSMHCNSLQRRMQLCFFHNKRNSTKNYEITSNEPNALVQNDNETQATSHVLLHDFIN